MNKEIGWSGLASHFVLLSEVQYVQPPVGKPSNPEDPHLSRKPPYELGEAVVSPDGPGAVCGYSQIPGDWGVRVELAAGGHWIGSSKLLRSKSENAHPSARKRRSRRKSTEGRSSSK